MLSQKDIQAQLKVNSAVLRGLLDRMDTMRRMAARYYEVYKSGDADYSTSSCLEQYFEYTNEYHRTKNKFLTLSAVQAKLKRMLANVARQEALKLDDIPF